MPLIHSKSKSAFKDNLQAEMGAGKPKDQSLAIAYSIQRAARKRKLAAGGAAEAEEASLPAEDREDLGRKGGEDEEDAPASISEAIMRKRKAMAMGGEVKEPDESEEEGDDSLLNDLDDTGEEAAPEPEDRLSQLRARLKSRRGY